MAKSLWEIQCIRVRSDQRLASSTGGFVVCRNGSQGGLGGWKGIICGCMICREGIFGLMRGTVRSAVAGCRRRAFWGVQTRGY